MTPVQQPSDKHQGHDPERVGNFDRCTKCGELKSIHKTKWRRECKGRMRPPQSNYHGE